MTATARVTARSASDASRRRRQRSPPPSASLLPGSLRISTSSVNPAGTCTERPAPGAIHGTADTEPLSLLASTVVAAKGL